MWHCQTSFTESQDTPIAGSLIPLVLTSRAAPQVADPIVQSVAIDVINLSGWPAGVEHQPSKLVPSNRRPEGRDLPVRRVSVDLDTPSSGTCPTIDNLAGLAGIRKTLVSLLKCNHLAPQAPSVAAAARAVQRL